jgi:hypothetical protein
MRLNAYSCAIRWNQVIVQLPIIPVYQELGPPFKRPENTKALVTAMTVGAAAGHQRSLAFEWEAEEAEAETETETETETGQCLRAALVARTAEIHHCPIHRD